MMEPVEFKRPHRARGRCAEETLGDDGLRTRAPTSSIRCTLRAEDSRAAQPASRREDTKADGGGGEERDRPDDDDPDILIRRLRHVARIARTSIDSLARKGAERSGLFRPSRYTRYPRSEALKAAAGRAKHVLVAELSMGRMVEDVPGRSSPDGCRGLFRAVRRYGDDRGRTG